MKLPMKLLRTAGLCLVAMFAMSMVAAVSASAEVPAWEHCTKGKVATEPPTKYTEHQCEVGSPTTGEWEWREVNGTEKVVSQGSLLLSDNEITILKIKVQVSCTGKDEGTVGPKKLDKIDRRFNMKYTCSNDENCEAGHAIEAKAANLPWQTELVEEGAGKVRDKITNTGTTEATEPGWEVTCTVDGIHQRIDVLPKKVAQL